MNRRQLLTTLATLPAASQLSAQSESKFRLRSGLVAYSYRKQLESKSLNYVSLIERVADWGLDGLDCTVYWFPDTSNEFLASVRKAAFKNGVQIYNIGVRVRLAQPTQELQDAEFAKLTKWVDVAERLGASHVRVFGGAIPNGATEEQAIGWAVEVLKRGGDYAGRQGITIGVEDDGGLTISAEPTVEIVKRTASPWVGVNADSGNLRNNGYSQFQMLLPYATSIHLKTQITTPDGKNEKADWYRLLEMVGKSNYKGYVGFEYEGNDADNDVPKYALELRTVVRRLSV
jgi:sugar phosphate isomerase/epimerase